MSLLRRIEQGQNTGSSNNTNQPSPAAPAQGQPKPAGGEGQGAGGGGDASRLSSLQARRVSAPITSPQAGSYFDLKTRVQNKLLA